MQNQQPFAYFCQVLGAQARLKSAYEKELMAVVLSVLKWRPYLLGQCFVVRTDKQSLKYLLEQRVVGHGYQKWVSKLMGYNFEIQYKAGNSNKAMDALSQREDQWECKALGAGTRQQAVPAGFEPDKSSWGWNWLERWMAVHPWENRFFDINLRDGVMICENGTADGKNGIETQLKPSSKKPALSSLQSNVSSLKTGLSHSDGSSSPNKSAWSVLEDLAEEANTRSGIVQRSQSNPKERSTQPDKQAKKRLSLPNSGC